VRDFGDQVNMPGIGLHRKFLFTNSNSSHAQVFFQHPLRLRKVRELIGEEDKILRILPGQLDATVVAARANRQSILRTGRQKHSPGNPHRALVRDQFGVASAGVIGVLMDVDDRLSGLHAHAVAFFAFKYLSYQAIVWAQASHAAAGLYAGPVSLWKAW